MNAALAPSPPRPSQQSWTKAPALSTGSFRGYRKFPEVCSLTFRAPFAQEDAGGAAVPAADLRLNLCLEARSIIPSSLVRKGPGHVLQTRGPAWVGEGGGGQSLLAPSA